MDLKVCRLRVGLHSLGYVVCFGVIVAKATQLRNAETLGFGTSTHISYWNYWQLLFFIVGVQIALSSRYELYSHSNQNSLITVGVYKTIKLFRKRRTDHIATFY